MKVLITVLAVGMIIYAAVGVVLYRRGSGEFPKWYPIGMIIGSLGLGVSVVVFQFIQ